MSGASGRPIPVSTPVSEPFWEGCRRSELLLQRCNACRTPQFYPRTLCAACGKGDLTWVRAKGEGEVLSYTVVRRAIIPAFKERIPYVVAIIKLAEGPQLMSHVVDCEPEAVRVGAPVVVAFEDLDGEASLPVFRLA